MCLKYLQFCGINRLFAVWSNLFFLDARKLYEGDLYTMAHLYSDYQANHRSGTRHTTLSLSSRRYIVIFDNDSASVHISVMVTPIIKTSEPFYAESHGESHDVYSKSVH